MSRKKQKYWEDLKRKVIVGRFYLGKLRRIDLCSSEDLDYKRTKQGRRKRTAQEKENYLDALYEHTLKSLLEPEEIAAAGPSIKTAAQDFLDSRQIAEKTRIGYVETLNYFVKHTKNIAIADLKPWHLTTFANRYRSIGHKASSIKEYLNRIRSFVRWCYDQEYIHRVPKFPRIDQDHKEPQPYTSEQIDLIEAHIRQYENNTMLRCFMMLKETGMRVGEVHALPLNCIEKQWILIKPQPQIGWKPKTKREDRVPISSKLRTYLDSDIRPKHHVWYLDNDAGYQHYDPSYIMTKFKNINRKLGIENSQPTHAFRSSLINRLLSQGVDLSLVMSIVRHSDSSITMKHYVQKKALPLHAALDLL